MASLLPQALTDFLHSTALEGRWAAHLKVDAAGRITACDGDLSRYGAEDARPGAMAEDAAPFLCGMLPLQGRSATFRWLEVAPGVTADLHLVKEGTDVWVMLLDATDDAARFQAFQQKGNEVTLERDRLRKKVAELEAQLRAALGKASE